MLVKDSWEGGGPVKVYSHVTWLLDVCLLDVFGLLLAQFHAKVGSELGSDRIWIIVLPENEDESDLLLGILASGRR